MDRGQREKAAEPLLGGQGHGHALLPPPRARAKPEADSQDLQEARTRSTRSHTPSRHPQHRTLASLRTPKPLHVSTCL